jgi:TonB family protein
MLVGACPVLAAWQDDGPFHVGGGVSAPRLVGKVEPEYSEEARMARLNGTVVLHVIVRPGGQADGIKVIRSLGLGLDENAIAAVGQWRFRAGEKEGQAVSVQATIEVNFRLLPNHRSEAEWYTAGVTFQTPSGATRPVLQFAKFPPNGDPPEQGSVTTSCLIDEQGIPTALRVEKSTAPALQDDALAFLRLWRFRPAMQGGKAVAVPATIVAAFGSPGAPPKPKAASTTL